MDALKYVLHAVRIKSQLFERNEKYGDWELKHHAIRGANIHLIEKGICLLQLDNQPPLALSQGDLVVISNMKNYMFYPIPQNPHVTFVNGEFSAEQNIIYPIFSLLPPLIHVPNISGQPVYWLATALSAIESEAQGKRPGYEAVISRLMDVLFIMVMRSWIDQQKTGEGGWLGALYDPYIGNVLHAIHGNPENHWSLEQLAQIATMSRSTFAERFTRMIGEPPMKYLTRWRIQLATTWITDDSTITIEQISQKVGYSSAFAFSKTFKRFMGVSPNHFRQMAKIDSNHSIISSINN